MSRSFQALLSGAAVGAVLFFLLPPEARAIPAFSRQYSTSCQTCHIAFPKLNDFGKAFKDAGFKFPKDDADFLKVAPTMLGAEASKETFPKSVWPGSIPGMPPIGLRYNQFFQVTSNTSKFNALTAQGTVPGFIPTTDFQTGFFSIFTAGNFGSDIAFWVDDDISVSGTNGAGGLGDAYLKFVNLSRFLKMPTDSLSFKVGQFELDLPFTQARTYDLSPYDIYSQANIGAMNSLVSLQQNVSNAFTFAGGAKGLEISGGHQYGGYHYSIAVFDQNTSGVGQSSNANGYVPSATGGSGGGVGFASDSNFKNVYGRFMYRFNLERDKISRNSVQAAGPTGPRDHTFLSLGTFYMYGKSLQRYAGALANGDSAVLNVSEPYYRAGGDFNFNYRRLNVYGLYMVGHDNNLLPIDAGGNLIVLPVGTTPAIPVGFIKSVPATFNGGFVQSDYLILPWILAYMRWDSVNSTADRINGLDMGTSSPFLFAFNSTRNRYTPGIQFLIHPNIKASMEYQIRPKQSLEVTQDPTTGALTAVNPFRANVALFALEFVY